MPASNAIMRLCYSLAIILFIAICTGNKAAIRRKANIHGYRALLEDGRGSVYGNEVQEDGGEIKYFMFIQQWGGNFKRYILFAFFTR